MERHAMAFCANTDCLQEKKTSQTRHALIIILWPLYSSFDFSCSICGILCQYLMQSHKLTDNV